MKVNYTGVSAATVIAEFRAVREKLRAVQNHYRPFKEEFLAIAEADKAVCAAADLLTGQHECLYPKLSQSTARPGDDEMTPQTKAAMDQRLK